jgi:peptidoglycan/LPS O-acetylase OafA/YrhL
MHARGRRLARPAPTIWTALAALAAVEIWGDQTWSRSYYAFLVVTAAALVAIGVAPRSQERAQRGERQHEL